MNRIGWNEHGDMGAEGGRIPRTLRIYIDHVEAGLSLRAIARREGCHPSTILRQVRRLENRRDCPLTDEALDRVGRLVRGGGARQPGKELPEMTAAIRNPNPIFDEARLLREARRILRRLSEPGALLAVAPDLERAVVMRDCGEGRAVRTGVVDRDVAQAFALREWICCSHPGRVARYRITPVGRAALRRMLERERAEGAGLAEAASPFADQHRTWDDAGAPGAVGDDAAQGAGATPRGGHSLRYNAAESPITALARRRDRDGQPFLAPDLVAAAERLREDFELAQMGPRVAQNWERFLTGADRGGFGAGGGPAEGPRAARERVGAALRDLGPGLGDVALRCCCFLEGLETAERRMGWSARSGKIVLRIALMRLKRHYDEVGAAPLIG